MIGKPYFTKALVPILKNTHCDVCDDLLLSGNGAKLTGLNLDIRNLLEIATNLYNTFWNPPSSSTTPNDYLYPIIKKRDLKPNLAAFFSIFANVLFLASPDAVEMLKGDIAKLLTKIWDGGMRSEGQYLWMEEVWFSDVTHLYIEYDAQAPFMTLYSMYSRGSMNSDAAFAQRTRVSEPSGVHPLQCAR